MPPKTSKSQLAASKKWDASNCKQLTIKFKIAEFAELDAICKQKGISRNGFVREAVAEAVKKAQGVNTAE